VVRGAHPFTPNVAMAHGMGDAGSNAFQALGWALGDMRQRRRLKRLLERVGEPVPIGEARRRSAGSLRATHLAGYRDSRLPLVFEGTRASPVWVFGPPARAG